MRLSTWKKATKCNKTPCSRLKNNKIIDDHYFFFVSGDEPRKVIFKDDLGCDEACKEQNSSKGQLISKCLFEKIVPYSTSGQNLSNFSVVFWSKQFFQKDILKLTDL